MANAILPPVDASLSDPGPDLDLLGSALLSPASQPLGSPETVTGSTARGRARGTRLPPDWAPTAEQLDAARAAGCRDVAKTAATFRDHWLAQPGQRGLKLDWAATWRNWVRREPAFERPSGVQRASGWRQEGGLDGWGAPVLEVVK
jgi:hypothetical protein